MLVVALAGFQRSGAASHQERYADMSELVDTIKTMYRMRRQDSAAIMCINSDCLNIDCANVVIWDHRGRIRGGKMKQGKWRPSAGLSGTEGGKHANRTGLRPESLGRDGGSRVTVLLQSCCKIRLCQAASVSFTSRQLSLAQTHRQDARIWRLCVASWEIGTEFRQHIST